MNEKKLVEIAAEVKSRAYCPYSKFHVGAALLTKSGKVFTGINIENASYGATNCAERTAIFKAVSEGDYEFEAIAIASDDDDYIYPCGVCRQVMSEFCSSDFKVICSDKKLNYKVFTMKEIMPLAFDMNT